MRPVRLRLHILIANDDIYQRLEATGAAWQDFIELCQALAKDRHRKRVFFGSKAFV